jgi:hypothetical protein
MNGKAMIKGLGIVAVALLCASASRVYAASAAITLNAEDMVYFGLANGLALPAGDAVYMGQFSISDTSIQALGAELAVPVESQTAYSTLVSDFVPLNVLSLNTIGTGALGDAGAIVATYNGSNSTFASGNVYLMVVNTATTAGASQVGVFRGDSTWTYPTSMATGVANFDTDQAITSPLIGAYTASQNAAAGGYAYDSDSGNDYGDIASLDLAVIASVPEPSTYMLVVLGMLGGIGMLRRRRS